MPEQYQKTSLISISDHGSILARNSVF